MQEAACERAQSVLLDKVPFSLSDEKFQQFTQLLDATPEKNEGLARLLAVDPVWSE